MDQKGMSGEEWERVKESIEYLGRYYERVNLAATFFLLPLWRSRVASASPEGTVLDLGCGPGGTARMLRSKKLICLDPSREMLELCRSALNGREHSLLMAYGESLPLKDGSIDAIFCSFSFRDFWDKRRVVQEAARVLSPGGSLHILEIGAPPPGLRRSLLDLWIEKAVPRLALLLTPKSVRRSWDRNPYGEFVDTYRAMGRPEEYAKILLHCGFEDVRYSYLVKDAVFHLQGVKPRTMS